MYVMFMKILICRKVKYFSRVYTYIYTSSFLLRAWFLTVDGTAPRQLKCQHGFILASILYTFSADTGKFSDL